MDKPPRTRPTSLGCLLFAALLSAVAAAGPAQAAAAQHAPHRHSGHRPHQDRDHSATGPETGTDTGFVSARHDSARRDTASGSEAGFESARHDSARRGTADRGAADREGAQHDSARRGSSDRGSSDRDGARHEPAREDSAEHDAAYHGSTRDESASGDSAYRQSAHHDSAHARRHHHRPARGGTDRDSVARAVAGTSAATSAHRAAPVHGSSAAPGLPAMHVMTVQGFDTCWAPPLSAMQAWYDNSPYRAIGIYIGGRNRACVGGNLTPSWVSAVSAEGWGLIPVYVGLQAPCVLEKGMAVMQPSQAAQEGAAEAADAAAQAKAYGLAAGSPVYFDLEAFRQTDQGCVTAVLAYLDAWTRQLHASGYYAGVYGSASSGITTLAQAVQTLPSFTPPDAIWIAHWDNQATTQDGSVPDTLWSHQRLKQYQGGHVEKHGGASIDIDSDYLDGPVARVQ